MSPIFGDNQNLYAISYQRITVTSYLAPFLRYCGLSRKFSLLNGWVPVFSTLIQHKSLSPKFMMAKFGHKNWQTTLYRAKHMMTSWTV